MVYRNLAAELIRSEINYDDAAKKLGITAKTFKAKMNGKSDWAWSQVKKLRNMVTTTSDIDYLFKENNTQKSA